MVTSNKERICRLLKGIETGDPSSVEVVNENKYIQHNPQTHAGSEGLAVLFKRLSKTSPRVNIVRIFEDGDYVFAHTEYDFASRNIGFEIFRFEDNQAVEHWDNIQPRLGPNLSGHGMVDGSIEIDDYESTESNRSLIQAFTQQVLIQSRPELLDNYITQGEFIEHNPRLDDNLKGLREMLSAQPKDQTTLIRYEKCHCILAAGNFVLTVCEGQSNEQQTSFFDLYRLNHHRIVEHWDTTETIPVRSEWKNDNGKFSF